MKRTIILLYLAFFTTCAFAAVSKFELLLGLRTGAGAMYSEYKLPLLVTELTTKEIGVSIPAKAEVLFGVKGFRFGYKFEYMYGMFSKRHLEYSPQQAPLFVDNSPKRTFSRHQFGHFGILEFAIPAGEHFAVVPGFAVGVYQGYMYDKGTKDKAYYKDFIQNPIAFGAAVNFEFNWNRIYFILGPNYTWYRLKPKDNSITGPGKGGIHNLTLDLAIRLNLLKPNYNKNK